jgi:hypothetical protein
MAYESITVRQRVIHDDVLRERVGSLLAKYANYLLALGASATEPQKEWARYVLADQNRPETKAAMMMWLVCWHANVKDAVTADIEDTTLSAIIEPHAILY